MRAAFILTLITLFTTLSTSAQGIKISLHSYHLLQVDTSPNDGLYYNKLNHAGGSGIGIDFKLKDSSSYRFETGVDLSYERYSLDSAFTCTEHGCFKTRSARFYTKFFFPVRIKKVFTFGDKRSLDIKAQSLYGLQIGRRSENDSLWGSYEGHYPLNHEIRLGLEVEYHFNNYFSIYSGGTALALASNHEKRAYLNFRTGIRVWILD